MSERVVRFTDVRIDRAPGVPPGGHFALAELSPCVNLIFGANGSGKTLTGHVLQALLWPQAKRLERPTISGTWTLGGQRWTVELDGGFPTWRCDGSPCDPPALPPPEARAYHWLGLRELLADGGEDAEATRRFAGRIAREMLGGYDIAGAAEALGFQGKPTQPRRDRDAYAEAVRSLNEASQQEAALHERVRCLEDLEEKRLAARAADEDRHRLERAIGHREAADRLVQLEQVLAEFDGAMDAVRGDEPEQLKRHRDERRRWEHERDDAQRRLAEAETGLADAGLPEGGVSDGLLAALDADVQALARHEGARTDVRRRLASATSGRDRCRAAIGDSVPDASLEGLGTVAPAQLMRLAGDAASVRAHAAIVQASGTELERERARLRAEQDGVDVLPPIDPLRRGHDALCRWLAAPAPSAAGGRRWSLAMLLAAGLIAVLVVLLAVLHNLAWLLGLLLAGPFVWSARPAQRAPGGEARPGHAAEYERLGLPRPDDWTVDAVRDRLQWLTDSWVRAERRQAEHERLVRDAQQHALRAEEAASKAQQLEHDRQAVASALGVPLEIDREDWLHVLGQALAGWQAAQTEVAGCSAELHQIERDLEQALGRFNGRIAPFVRTVATDPGTARGMYTDLAERARRHREAKRALDAARRELARAREEIERLNGDIRALFSRVGLQDGDDALLLRLVDRLDPYRHLQEEVRDERIRRDRLVEELRDRGAWLELDRATLESERAEAERRSDDLTRIEQEIGAVKAEMDRAKRTHSIEDAMRRLDRAAGVLLRHREEAERAAVGDALADWLREESGDRTRPAVLRRAGGFFQRITHGRYDLRLVDRGGGSAFAAWDAREEREKDLGQLSTGERVQLLLAVRLGFLEHEDGGIRLPMILDETLGTTDDERAGAVIDAVIEICRAGRQVFYFTAQPDEVGKWISRLEGEPDLILRHVDLGQLRRLTEAETSPLRIQRPPSIAIPEVEGLDHDAYGRTLGVPELDPAAGVGAVHIWHVLGDPHLLRTLLVRRIREWGPFRQLAGSDGTGLPGVEPAVIACAQAKARAIHAAFEAWRVGRGRPVDRQALEASGAVSPVFIERVTELCAACGADARRLLVALDEGQLPRWRTSNTDQLRAYLEEHGYLDGQDPLPRDEIHHRVLRVVAADLDGGRLDDVWLDRMIGGLPGVGGFEAAATPSPVL